MFFSSIICISLLFSPTQWLWLSCTRCYFAVSQLQTVRWLSENHENSFVFLKKWRNVSQLIKTYFYEIGPSAWGSLESSSMGSEEEQWSDRIKHSVPRLFILGAKQRFVECRVESRWLKRQFVPCAPLPPAFQRNQPQCILWPVLSGFCRAVDFSGTWGKAAWNSTGRASIPCFSTWLCPKTASGSN